MDTAEGPTPGGPLWISGSLRGQALNARGMPLTRTTFCSSLDRGIKQSLPLLGTLRGHGPAGYHSNVMLTVTVVEEFLSDLATTMAKPKSEQPVLEVDDAALCLRTLDSGRSWHTGLDSSFADVHRAAE